LLSLRTLSRALEYARVAMPIYGMQRALMDGLSMVRLLGCLLCLLSDAEAR
jgi:midasin (ATPase involved in ribosome maturation)